MMVAAAPEPGPSVVTRNIVTRHGADLANCGAEVLDPFAFRPSAPV
jgi:hypothetical protein